MTTERDRLAADLHDIACGASSRAEWDLCVRDHRHEADRLIALGWTRLDIVHRRLHPSHPELDVCEYRDCRIARAYREDTDD